MMEFLFSGTQLVAQESDMAHVLFSSADVCLQMTLIVTSISQGVIIKTSSHPGLFIIKIIIACMRIYVSNGRR